MKIEAINVSELLQAYIKQNYRDSDVLVVFQEVIDSLGSHEELFKDLDDIGLFPPKIFIHKDFMIIEMRKELATKIINKYSKSVIHMELYSNGDCIHETD